MNVQDVLRARIEKLIPGGDGLARVDGLAVFIPGALPGELVEAALERKTKNWARTGKPEILEASPDRREPFCPLYGICGGCSWQHLSYEAQLKAKVSIVREVLLWQGGFQDGEIPDFHITPSSPRNYRSRIRPTIIRKGIGGFLESGSDRLVEIPACPVATPGINRFFQNLPETLVAGQKPVVFGNDDQFWVEGVHPEARTVVSGKEFRFPPGVFFQSNLLILESLLGYALSHPGIRSNRRSMDLYGGVGLFGAFLADRFDHVIGVDRDPGAEFRWKDHVGPKGEFHASTLERWVSGKKKSGSDFVVVDPPRTGLTEKVRQALVELQPPAISYVSCDPVTQARDIADFRSSGYELDSLGVFDMYPQTPHVETVARLSRCFS